MNYYEVLGISQGATPQQIAEAYRKKARQYHPDHNPDGAAEFKKISEAFEVLNDPQKRQQYDQRGSFPGFGGFPGGFPFNVDFGRGWRQPRDKPIHYHERVEISFEESVLGCDRKIFITRKNKCEHCTNGFSDWKQCPACAGVGKQRVNHPPFVITIDCELCGGEGEAGSVPCEACSGRGYTDDKTMEEVIVHIPPGTSRLRLRGKGGRGKIPGDLYVGVYVKPHLFYRREKHIVLNLPLSYTQLIFGDEVEVPTIVGKAKLKIPPATQPGTRFKLKNIPKVGTMIVEVNVEIPSEIPDESISLLMEYEKSNLTPMREKYKEFMMEKR